MPLGTGRGENSSKRGVCDKTAINKVRVEEMDQSVFMPRLNDAKRGKTVGYVGQESLITTTKLMK